MIVVGGGKIGYHLTKALAESGHEVLLIEKDPVRLRWLEENLGAEAVMQADGSDPSVLEKVGIRRASVLAAVTGSDEDNIIACQLGKQFFGTPRVVGRVNNPKNEPTFRLLGIRSIINSTALVYHLVEQGVGVASVIPLLALREGAVEFVELIIPAGSPAVGKQLKDLALPTETLIVAIIRGDRMIVPGGQDALREDDSVIAMTSPQNVQKLNESLLGA